MSGQRDKGQKRKRPKSYYIKCSNQNAKRSRHNHLEVGMKGFLVTCGSKEEIGLQESLSILNEYADKMYGPELLSDGQTAEGASGDNTTEDGSKDDGSEEEEDIEKALEKELAALKEKKTQSRRFQRINCPAKNCIFIKSNMAEDPLDLTLNILRDLAETRVPKSRYAQRLLPVQATCKVFYDDILKCVGNLVESYFRCPFGTKRTYSVMFKCRNNFSISREKMLAQIGQLIRDMNPLNETVYRNPDRIILVEICNKVCCIAMVYDFFELRKFNLVEVASPRVEEKKLDPSREKPDPSREKPDPSREKQELLTTASEDKKEDGNHCPSDNAVTDENKTEIVEEKKKNEDPSENSQAESLPKNDSGETNQSENQTENNST